MVALVLSMITYRLVENPIRRAPALVKRPVVSVLLGACLILASLAVAQWQIHAHSGANGIGPSSVTVHSPPDLAMNELNHFSMT